MTRTGASPRLARHLPEPFVEINPEDAAAFGVVDGGFARLATEWGVCVLRARVTDRQPKGNVFAPIHWTDETSAQARVGALVAPFVDPVSGQPESKATPAAIAPCAFAREGFLLARKPVALPREVWWTRVAIADGVGYRIASDVSDSVFLEFLRCAASSDDVIQFQDDGCGIFRAATFIDDRAEFVFSIASSPTPWDAALALFSLCRLGEQQRIALLSGRRESGVSDDGPVVCACFGVGAKRIEAEIEAGRRSASEIGRTLRAGTNCGSCIPEIQRMIRARASD